jgi:hypothetical protein
MVDIQDNLSRARKLIHQLDQTDMQRWQEHGFPSYRWWLLVVFLVAPWIIWVKLADRRKLPELLLVGTLVMIVTLLLDVLGYNVDFWDYPVEILPLGVPGALPFDLSMVPVPYMLIYQYCSTWKSYLLALLAMAVVYAFIGEPLANWLDLVVYMKWTNLYSFFYYIAVGIGVRALVRNMTKQYSPT